MANMDVTWMPFPFALLDPPPETINLRHAVHFVGSVPVDDPAEVFKLLTEGFPRQLKRLPDGHPGVRKDVFRWQTSLLQATGLGLLIRDEGHTQNFSQREMSPSWQSLLSSFDTQLDHYAISSFNIFSRFKSLGLIPRNVRFQVSVPLPQSIGSSCIAAAYQEVFEPYYEAAIGRAISSIQAHIPHNELAIQIDCHGIVTTGPSGTLEGSLESVEEGMTRLSRFIETGVELGFHICSDQAENDTAYGIQSFLDLANALIQRIDRPISYFHLPFTTGDSIAARFSPLRALPPANGTSDPPELYIGLFHGDASAIGQRIEAAERAFGRDAFGVSTACGLGDNTAGEFRRVLQQLKEHSTA